MVAMERSSHVDSHMSYQIVTRCNIEKVTKFSRVCFDVKKVINVQSRRGQNPRPVWNRFKLRNCCENKMISSHWKNLVHM